MKTPWWKFWNPRSGLFGGLLFGLIIVILIILSGCDAYQPEIRYRQKLIEVTCEYYTGHVYLINQTGTGIRFVWYEDTQGRKIEIPDNCVKVTLEEYPPPQKERPQNEGP